MPAGRRSTVSNFWSLRNKGITFIIVPLIFQVVFVLALTVFLNQE